MPYYPTETDETKAAHAALQEALEAQASLMAQRSEIMARWGVIMASASNLVALREREYHQAMREANPEVRD